MSNEKFILAPEPVTGPTELNELKAFLRSNSLPFDDVQLEGNIFVIYRDSSGKLVGTGGLEFHGDHCLLRSVAVSTEFLGGGFGKEIVKDLIARATTSAARSVFLLTETAHLFFEKFGFKKLSRDEAPKDIQASSEFSSVCPVSAVFMSLNVT
jgi:amino-acid N-acetyltransferase